MELRPGRAGALLDSPDGVVLTGAPPGALVTIEAALDLGGHGWDVLHPHVPPSVIGISRGSELALLAASLMPDEIGPVVSQAGSGVPWGAFGPGADDNDPAWLLGGAPVRDRVTLVAYPDAGHWCAQPPGFPIASAIVHPVDGTHTLIGGSRAGNNTARLDAWRRLLEHVGAPFR